MQQELGIMRQHLFPADRVIQSLLKLGRESLLPPQQTASRLNGQGPLTRSDGKSRCSADLQEPGSPSLLAVDTVDFLEEVQVGLLPFLGTKR